jgi:hypothetical protein
MRLFPALMATALLAGSLPAFAQNQTPSPGASPTMSADVTGTEAIDRVWSGHSVRFALLLTKTRIVIGYYDANRQLTIAARPKTGGAWIYQKLDTWNDWDSHNYIALGEDNSGRLHVAANMHSSPLTAFRSDPGGDVLTLKRVNVLVDKAVESSMTYPIFLHDQSGRLILKYRDGSSGNGNEIYDVFDDAAGTWSHLLASPLVDGETLRNAYFMGPVLGPDKWFHIAWVWRETPMAETNHDLTYAKSPDLIHWFDSDGKPLALPIKLSKAEIVDPVPVKGGMINNNTIIGFDDKGRAMITYHKYDKAGNTQIWVARYEGKKGGEAKGWHLAQVSQWKNYRWDFSGGGSLNSEIFVSGVSPVGNGLLKVPVIRLGQSIDFIIKSDDLSLVEEKPVQSLSDQLKQTIKIPEGMQLNVVNAAADNGTVYALAWPARPPHRDLPSADIPDPATLLFLTLKAK